MLFGGNLSYCFHHSILPLIRIWGNASPIHGFKFKKKRNFMQKFQQTFIYQCFYVFLQAINTYVSSLEIIEQRDG
jgi:hypothetical protein